MWGWLENDTPKSWGFLLRVIVKALVVFGACNLIFALIYPMETIGSLSLYNLVFAGRERLPYGENPAASYNITTNNIPAMFRSHVVSQPPTSGELRVFVFGNSGTRGHLNRWDETATAQINAQDLTINDRRVVTYNLAYPMNSLTKDLLLIDAALAYQADLVVWLVSPVAVMPENQLTPTLVTDNQARVQELHDNFGLAIDPDDEAFLDLNWRGRTLIVQRRTLADLLRLQSYGVAWTALRIDEDPDITYEPVRRDLSTDLSWGQFDEPTTLQADDLRFDIIETAQRRLGDVPLLVVNEAIFISDGENSSLRYNSLFPRWAYDQYRDLLAQVAADNRWNYLDLWDSIDPQEFTDTPLHYTPEGARQLAQPLATAITDLFEERDN